MSGIWIHDMPSHKMKTLTWTAYITLWKFWHLLYISTPVPVYFINFMIFVLQLWIAFDLPSVQKCCAVFWQTLHFLKKIFAFWFWLSPVPFCPCPWPALREESACLSVRRRERLSILMPQSSQFLPSFSHKNHLARKSSPNIGWRTSAGALAVRKGRRAERERYTQSVL